MAELVSPLVAIHKVLVLVCASSPSDPNGFANPSCVSGLVSGDDLRVFPLNDMVFFHRVFRYRGFHFCALGFFSRRSCVILRAQFICFSFVFLLSRTELSASFTDVSLFTIGTRNLIHHACLVLAVKFIFRMDEHFFKTGVRSNCWTDVVFTQDPLNRFSDPLDVREGDGCYRFSVRGSRLFVDFGFWFGHLCLYFIEWPLRVATHFEGWFNSIFFY